MRFLNKIIEVSLFTATALLVGFAYMLIVYLVSWLIIGFIWVVSYLTRVPVSNY